MPQVCAVCSHPERAQIDHALIRRRPMRVLGREHGVSKDSLYRHAHDHLPKLLTKAYEAEEVSRADELLEEVRELHRRTVGLLDKAEAASELSTALRAVREYRGNLELLARLQGELQDGATVNIAVNPQWVELRTLIVGALSPYPDAQGAVLEAIRGARHDGS